VGQKVHPNGFRLGVIQNWSSLWYAQNKNYADLLHEDLKLRDYVKKRLYHTGVAKIDLERAGRKTKIHIYTARPGLVIGQRGAEVDKLRYELEQLTGHEMMINIHEVLSPELCATLVAESIAQQLERRIAFRRAMKRAMQSAMRLGAKGVRINVSGRLGGAEIARMEWYREGRVPLHTLRADIDYGFTEAKTTYGIIGVKVWVFKGEVLEHDPMAQDKRWAQEASGPSSNEGRERGGPRGDRGPRRDRGREN